MSRKRGRIVECDTCGKPKAPWGRSVPLEASVGYCAGWNCKGYHASPTPDTLWPGEATNTAPPDTADPEPPEET